MLIQAQFSAEILYSISFYLLNLNSEHITNLYSWENPVLLTEYILLFFGKEYIEWI